MSEKILKKGEKIFLEKENQKIKRLKITLEWSMDIPADIDCSVFLLGMSNKCKSDEDILFFNQPLSKNKAVKLTECNNQAEIQVEFNLLPNDIEKIAITLTIYDEGIHFNKLNKALLKVNTDLDDCFLFDFSKGYLLQNAIIAANIYRYKNQWKLECVANGYNGGLEAMCNSFGIEVEKEEKPVIQTSNSHKKVELSKIDLSEKGNQAVIFLDKYQPITVQLIWEGRKYRMSDLDLYCFYVTKKNEQGKVYYNNLGDIHEYPNIQLHGDSKEPGIEELTIARPENLNYVLVAAYSAVENGFGSFFSYKAKAVIINGEKEQITVPITKKNIFSYWVAIAFVDFTNLREIKIKKVETYSKSFSEKSPKLYIDGSFKMDEGEEEFKDIKPFK